jgi:hypothetical protein
MPGDDATKINWPYLLDEHVDENLQYHMDDLGQTEGGRLFHNWVKNTFDDILEDVEFEGTVENGRYDAFDGTCVYEFKTKHPNVFEDNPPYDRDIEQVEKYLESDDLDADFGIITYVNRGDLTEVQEYLVNGSVTEL